MNNGEHFVGYFLPTDECLAKRQRDLERQIEYDADDEYDFKLTREYTWKTMQEADNKTYEKNYFFVLKDDGIYYNELETR